MKFLDSEKRAANISKHTDVCNNDNSQKHLGNEQFDTFLLIVLEGLLPCTKKVIFRNVLQSLGT